MIDAIVYCDKKKYLSQFYLADFDMLVIHSNSQ